MVSARTVFEEIRRNDATFQLFCSIALKGEAQGGFENQRIAELTRDPVLAAKIARHGRDETKHGRLFRTLLRKRGLDEVPVPESCDYCALLEARGIGLSHERLAEDRPLRDDEVIAYLAHSRVTEQRAAEEIALQERVFGTDPEIGKAVRMIAADEENHLAYCHEELLRFAETDRGRALPRMLRRYALEEIRTYREVSLAVIREMGAILRWSLPKRALLALGIWCVYAIERGITWRRMTNLRRPARENAMGEGLRAA